MKKKFKNLKSGQKVWSIIHGKGIVYLINSEAGFFNVRFGENNGFIKSFHFDGKDCQGALFREIYLKKPVITTKKRLSYLTAESFGKGMMDGEHLERLFSENINLSEVVEKVLSMASEHVMESEGSDFGIYMLKHQISDHIKGQFITVHTMKPSKK